MRRLAEFALGVVVASARPLTALRSRTVPTMLILPLRSSRGSAETPWRAHGVRGAPRTEYAKSGDVHVAYQVLGDGPLNLVFVPGFVSHVEHFWEDPSLARFLRRLGSFSRLVFFDKRGTGLSDRVSEAAVPTLEERMDDVRAVMDAVGFERAAIFAPSDAGSMAILFAATYPERTTALVLYGTF